MVSSSEATEAEIRQEIAVLLPDLRAYARFLTRDRIEADDVVQEAILRSLAAISQFQPGTNLKGWLFTIVRNGFYEHIRRRRREHAVLEQCVALHEIATAPQPDQNDMRDLNRFIWALPPLLREALVLVGAQELSHEQAAEICGVPVGTMKARVSRARTQLRKAMAEAVQ